jgi:hypothetical protein
VCVLVFSTSFVWNISHSKKKWTRYDQKCILVFMYLKYPSFLSILIKLEFSRQIFEKLWNIIFQENPSSGRRGWTDVQTDMTKLIFAFLSFGTRLKLYIISTPYSCVLYLSQDKERPIFYTTNWFSQPRWKLFTAQYEMGLESNSLRFFFKGLNVLKYGAIR